MSKVIPLAIIFQTPDTRWSKHSSVGTIKMLLPSWQELFMVVVNFRIHANFDYSQRTIWGGYKWGMRLGALRNSPVLLNRHLLGCRVSSLNKEATITDPNYLKRFSTEQVRSILLLFSKQWKYNNYNNTILFKGLEKRHVHGHSRGTSHRWTQTLNFNIEWYLKSLAELVDFQVLSKEHSGPYSYYIMADAFSLDRDTPLDGDVKAGRWGDCIKWKQIKEAGVSVTLCLTGCVGTVHQEG